MSLLAAHDLKKAFGSRAVLDGATIIVEEGERVGLVGLNGSGKSTLVRILAGLEPADGGTVARRRGAELGYLEQEPTLDPEQTPREVVLAGLAAWSEAKARYDAVSAKLASVKGDSAKLLEEQAAAAADVERLGGWDRMHHVDEVLGHVGLERLDAKVGTMSGGERRRVALARLLVARPALAILDEPSNHLDVDTIAWLERYLLEEYGGAVLLITHDRYLLDRVATRTVELDRGKLYSYDGGYEAYLEAKAERLAHEARTEQNRQNFLRTELEWLRRQPKARSTKQKARIERAETAKAIAAPKAERIVELAGETSRAGKTVLDLRGVDLAIGGRTLVHGLDLVLAAGDRVGIVGRNGTGKTTLLRAALGELAPTKGEIVRGVNTKIAYFDQQRSGLDDDKSIFDNVGGDKARIQLGGRVLEVRSYLERFLFDPQKQRQPVGSLSGGERARVALAKMLAEPHNLLVLDEPTNDLDVATLGALEAMLLETGASALVVTHDRWFLDRVATSILAFEGDGRVVKYAGGYSDYQSQKAAAEAEKAEREAAARPSARPEADKASAKPAKGGKDGLTWAERKELETILERIDEAEQRVAALERKLADPALYASGAGADAVKIGQDLAKAKDDAAKLVARWEELETKREAAKA